ncbi:methyl-accepting chemotaxis protein [Methylibium petroleiphilum]|uniref:methyl-accepting chemotaxis protein n=1 Tax=Methylibium petroleiphilum TaxID=105560 RepID=UPI001ACB7AC9|nr:methyl-accepting chemotaxis protein [Methylibium petroleiphilum]MBN9205295.1 MCP four helix bundle domain-containing protein [Methylibium petroleiphilum]
MTVRTKLSLTFGGLSVLVLFVAGLAMKSLAEEHDQFVDYVHGVNARAQAAADVRAAVDRRAIAARNLVLVRKADDLAAEQNSVVAAHEAVQANLGTLNQLVARAANLPETARSLVAEMNRIEGAYGPVALEIVRLAAAGQHDAAIARMNADCRPLLAALVKASDDYRDYTLSRAVQLTETAEADYLLHRNLLILGCVIAFLSAAVSGTLITRSLTRALGAEPDQLGTVAQRVAQGDLSRVDGAADAPRGSVLASLGAMQASLADIVGRVRNSSDCIATGSAQIATGNADLSQRTEEQASNLQQTAASMEELTATVKQNADTARQATQLAGSASGAAAHGGSVVSEVVATMGAITESSRKISDIIGVIDGIAFQTNILALNAAVEAARAGEQGRGFAVVAGEVRNLAQRSAEAAKEIKALIEDSVEKVGTGSRLVNDAGQSMNEIVAQVQRVNDLISEISAASVEQSGGISQIGNAVNQLDQVTQQNAALVEESAAAAESLKHQAATLADLVSVFRIEGSLRTTSS